MQPISAVPVLSTGTKNNFSTINLYFSSSSKTGTEFYCIVRTRTRTILYYKIYQVLELILEQKLSNVLVLTTQYFNNNLRFLRLRSN